MLTRQDEIRLGQAKNLVMQDWIASNKNWKGDKAGFRKDVLDMDALLMAIDEEKEQTMNSITKLNIGGI